MLKSTYLFLLLSLISFTVLSQENILVQAGVTIKDVSNRPVGINMNYLMDDDTYLNPSKSATNALKEMGVKILRFPGGEKSDNYLWGQRPFTSANHTLASEGNCYWPNNDPRFTENDYKTLKASTLDFDEFMVVAQQTGSQPLIVVNGDGHYRSPSTCNGLPVRDSLILAAQEWVRYANITKNLNIKYWMVGNETFNNTTYTESVMADLYRQDLILFAQAMKAVDPTIKIIANGKSDNWWKIVLSDPVAASLIDYLGLSVYPMWNWTTGYEVYRTTSPNFVQPITTAVSAINKYVTNPSDRERIRTMATEINAIDWGNMPWPNNNDLGHALVAFDMMGKQLTQPKLDYALFWNTRWVNNQTQPNHIYDALSSNGNLQANGKVMGIWGNYLLDSLVSVNSTSRIVSYASRSLDKLQIILINKDTLAHQVSLNIADFTNTGSAARHVFKGSSLTDTNPAFTAATTVTAVPGSKNAAYNFSADRASITVLSLSTSSFLLPVALNHYEVKKVGVNTKISWQTIMEKNNAGFTVQVSEDARHFRNLGYIPAQKNINNLKSYEFLDQEKGKSGIRYYRLKQTDENGQETLYEIKPIAFSGPAIKATIFPNPVQQAFELQITTTQKTDLNFSVADNLGNQVIKNKISLEKGLNRVPIKLNHNHAAGLYFLHLLSENTNQHIKFIKN